ncbi:hypothetical protein C8E83_3243 [Frondihabitans australicus]|uniref:Uncharacterized protein n=1 Tax=Frondihabitans australicus TaxID=386892 RepID=A0A495IJV9_9MICO|nr:hypothetical protein C8E83_3243 [Frondihabitans australicus]
MDIALWCLIGAIALVGFVFVCMAFSAMNKSGPNDY